MPALVQFPTKWGGSSESEMKLTKENAISHTSEFEI